MAIQKLTPLTSGDDSPFVLLCQIPTTTKKDIVVAKIAFRTRKFSNQRIIKNMKIYGIKCFINLF